MFLVRHPKVFIFLNLFVFLENPILHHVNAGDKMSLKIIIQSNKKSVISRFVGSDNIPYQNIKIFTFTTVSGTRRVSFNSLPQSLQPCRS